MAGGRQLEQDMARGLLHAIPAAVLLVDPSARIVFANAHTEVMFGQPAAELVGRALDTLVPDRGRDGALLARGRDGREFLVEMSVSPVPLPGGRYVAVMLRDAGFRALFAEAPEGVIVADADGRSTDINAAACQMLGCARDQLVGRTVFEILGGEDAPRLVDAREPSQAPDWVEVWEWTLKRKDGTFVPIEVTGQTLSDGRRQVFVRDISRRRQKEQELREVTALLDSIIENVPATIFVKDAKDFHFERFNRAGEDLLGIAREAVLGKNDYDLFPKEQADFFRLRDRETLNERRLVVVPEEPVRTATGTRWLYTMKIPILDGVGTPLYILGISVDITDRRRAERESEDSLRWLRAVLEQSPVGLILVHGPDGARVDANRRAIQMVGGPLGPIERHGEILSAPDGRPLDRASLPGDRALHGEESEGVELLLRTADGKSIPILSSSAPIVGADGTVQGAVVAFQDVTEAKELEHLRAEWGSIVAHDLRQPLQSIALSAHTLARVTSDPSLQKYIERIRSSAERLNRMVGDLMDVSGLDARRLELIRQPTDVTAIVRDSVERMALEAPDRSFDVTVEGDLPKAYADPGRIAQVMENLLTNAVKYGRAATPIVVDVAHVNDDVSVAVTNIGDALPEEELPRLFERFHRTAGAKRGAAKGAGLGLYITRGLVEAHGGRITAESTLAGVITFRFTLPVAG